ncbi:BLUF domain-containing protein [Pseudoalteromonas sp. C2R02]|uniref:BLUF domain-containing protein n=1 Tax=Pseudoalteromonas sp. C2R02 TaxID=2841565 RepID=UPI001C08F968|nr:BLUF domain-containing protein [Pseudoalteromonas sp. C2R02]MBU2972323.1 BLUF domain-containing protein [Pseudoalteromonas sp. C2R02]
MFLVRIVYASTISDDFQAEDIDNILQKSRINNAKKHVTGLLCFNRNFFLQCLEGSRTEVNKIYHRILNDPRHNNITLLNYEDITEREFSNWDMAYLPISDVISPLIIRYSGTKEFNPYKMSGESSHRLMIDLLKYLPKEE